MESPLTEKRVVLITGTSRGIGQYLAQHYLGKFRVVGCSRGPASVRSGDYKHFRLDVADEANVKQMLSEISDEYGRLDVLINNAGVASMNHFLLTPTRAVEKIFKTNFLGTFLLCREAAKLMKRNGSGRIVNFVTVATPLKLEGEAVYAASKAAVTSFTLIIARELAPYHITVNAIGPTPVQTDMIKSVPREKIQSLLERQAIPRFAELPDIANVIDFFIQPESDFITGQVIFLGGV